ncbi:MAG: hypothetical protein GOU98_02085 [Candidatus Altiarchaeota archaeon]|nr:hypothetical protein [Candidatus Altiarchaeota archaeon]
MSGIRGFATMLFAIVAGALLAVTAFFAMSQATRLEMSAEIFLADLSTLDMLYNGRNIQEYFVIGQDDLIKAYIEKGGPGFCGFTSIDNKVISIWESGECLATYDYSLSQNETGELAKSVISSYASRWGLEYLAIQDRFCLKFKDNLPFGKYESTACFDSYLIDGVNIAIQDMFVEYNAGGGTCVCQGTYNICWVDVNGHNFTYARETC